MTGAAGANPSTAVARALVAVLPGLGVGHVVLCPGSRSAPLAYALAAAERAELVRLHVRHDERSAGFTAVGIGRAGGLAAVVTTSGTAVANLHPAVLEAHHGGVPLLVLTADRPHAVRGTWANQTSDLQSGLFGPATRFAADLATGGGGWATTLERAVRAARGQRYGPRPGPVHLDLAFDDPLAPDDDAPPSTWAVPPSVPARGDSPASPAGQGHSTVERGPRTVVVAGDGATWQARWLAEAGGWPLLAEPTSGARSGPNAVAAYRLLLDHPALGGAVERVVVLGRPTLSRSVTSLLARADVELVVVSQHTGEPGPAAASRRVLGDLVPAWLEHAPKGWYREPVDPWLAAWQHAGTVAAQAVDTVLDSEGHLTGPLLARELWACLGEEERLVAAASNAIRDLDLAGHPWPDDDPGAGRDGRGVLADRVLANRGLSGIDGTLSTAVGVAVASRARTRVLVGDLAFLHDLGGLVVPAAERDLDLQVVVLDDDGGGIFGLLEHGEPQRAMSFERVFGTPHGADVAALARSLGLPVTRADDVAGLRAVFADPAPGLSVVHVPVGRTRLRALHARVRTAVEEAVQQAMADGDRPT